MTSFQIFAARLVPCKLIDMPYLFMMGQGKMERGRQGNKQVYPGPPPAAKKGEVQGTDWGRRGGGRPPSKCKKSALHNIFQLNFFGLQWPPCQIAWSLFSPLICHTWLFFRQRFESFANDSVTFRLHVTEDSICSDLAFLPTFLRALC